MSALGGGRGRAGTGPGPHHAYTGSNQRLGMAPPRREPGSEWVWTRHGPWRERVWTRSGASPANAQTGGPHGASRERTRGRQTSEMEGGWPRQRSGHAQVVIAP